MLLPVHGGVPGGGAVIGVLSEFERRVLADVETQLRYEDPELAGALVRMRPPRGVRWPASGCALARLGYDLVVLFAALEAMVCLMLYHTGSGPAGLLAAGFAGLTAAQRQRRFPQRSHRRQHSGPR